ncbi:MAG: hypothetical protein V1663_02350 [archaeon]
MAQDKLVKKKWYNIMANKDFNNMLIGETTCKDKNQLIGRIVSYNLGQLTRDIKLQNVKVGFKINKVEDNNAYTEIVKYELISSYIKRVVRVGRSRLDDSFICMTKDNVKVRIKVLVLTRNIVQKGLLTNMRKKIREYFSKLLIKDDYEVFLTNLIFYKLQGELRRDLGKVYPVAVCEVRMMVKLK